MSTAKGVRLNVGTEILVVIACLTGKGCPESAALYYDTHPELQSVKQVVEDKYISKIPDFIKNLIVPAIAIGGGASGSIKIDENFSIQGNKDEQTIVYNLSF
jgi:hypothetical protein